uniref:Uncharacterized protein n=1 Tax=Parascaris equorum TaxID=6256 RepID=A0A914R7R1_PAREQ
LLDSSITPTATGIVFDAAIGPFAFIDNGGETPAEDIGLLGVDPGEGLVPGALLNVLFSCFTLTSSLGGSHDVSGFLDLSPIVPTSVGGTIDPPRSIEAFERGTSPLAACCSCCSTICELAAFCFFSDPIALTTSITFHCCTITVNYICFTQH